jgi:hypothetical protein
MMECLISFTARTGLQVVRRLLVAASKCVKPAVPHPTPPAYTLLLPLAHTGNTKSHPPVKEIRPVGQEPTGFVIFLQHIGGQAFSPAGTS